MLKLVSAVVLLFLSYGIQAQDCHQNQSESHSSVNEFVSSASPFFYHENSGIKSYIDKLKEQYKCEGTRGKDRLFTLSVDSVQGNTISGLMTPGSHSVVGTQHFVGVQTGFKDILVISKTADNKFNVYLSLCNVKGQTTDFISDDLALENFHLDFATLSTSAACPAGSIVQANIRFQNPSFGQDGRSFTQACWN